MLSKNDLQSIAKIIDERIEPLKQDVGILKQDVGILKQDVGVLKQDVGGLQKDMIFLKKKVKKIDKNFDIMAKLYNKEDMELAKRVTRIENHLELSPLH